MEGYGGREKGEGVHVCLAHVNGLDGYPPDCTCMLSLRLDLHMFLLSSEASCMYMYIKASCMYMYFEESCMYMYFEESCMYMYNEESCMYMYMQDVYSSAESVCWGASFLCDHSAPFTAVLPSSAHL